MEELENTVERLEERETEYKAIIKDLVNDIDQLTIKYEAKIEEQAIKIEEQAIKYEAKIEELVTENGKLSSKVDTLLQWASGHGYSGSGSPVPEPPEGRDVSREEVKVETEKLICYYNQIQHSHDALILPCDAFEKMGGGILSGGIEPMDLLTKRFVLIPVYDNERWYTILIETQFKPLKLEVRLLDPCYTLAALTVNHTQVIVEFLKKLMKMVKWDGSHPVAKADLIVSENLMVPPCSKQESALVNLYIVEQFAFNAPLALKRTKKLYKVPKVMEDMTRKLATMPSLPSPILKTPLPQRGRTLYKTPMGKLMKQFPDMPQQKTTLHKTPVEKIIEQFAQTTNQKNHVLLPNTQRKLRQQSDDEMDETGEQNTQFFQK